MKRAKILFFVDGMAPTAADFAEASEMAAQICFRNARAVSADSTVEACDGVAGCVPPLYAELPAAADAIKAFSDAAKAEAAKLGEKPAPARKTAPAAAQKAAPAAAPKPWTPNA